MVMLTKRLLNTINSNLMGALTLVLGHHDYSCKEFLESLSILLLEDLQSH